MAATVSVSKKAAIRAQIKDVLNNLSNEEIEDRSSAIFKKVISMSEFISSSSICIYLSMPTGEVQSYVLLQNSFDNKKRVFIPKVMGKNSEDLKIFELQNYATIENFPRSRWGIPEPPMDFVQKSIDATYLGLVDCVLMPGVAFDSRCARIGHGKGYYGESIPSYHELSVGKSDSTMNRVYRLLFREDDSGSYSSWKGPSAHYRTRI